MINEKEIYKHLKNGGDPQLLYDAFLDELNAAQKKVNAEAEAEKAKAKENEAKTQAREAAVTALSTYFTLVLPKELVTKDVNIPELVEEALDSLEDTIKLLKDVDVNIKINGKPLNIFDL